MTEVMFRLSGRVDVADWRRRHARGEVPDSWPYGLDRLASYGVRVTPAPAYTGDARLARAARGLGRYEWLESRTSSGTPDAELCWDERVGVPAARRRGGPPVVTGVIWLTDEQRTSRVHRLLAGPGLRRAHRVWALSSAQLPVLRDDFGVPERRLVHLPFGIDADFFTPGLGAGPSPGLLVGAGNDRHRDHPTLVAAVAQVRRDHPGVRLELATRQPIDVPAALGVRHSSLTHGQMRDLYRRGSVTVVALRPNLHVSGISVALEAMACGRPVVITDTPGMRDYLTDGHTGLLVPPGDPAALAAAVTSLVAEPERAREMGEAARKEVEERFSTQVQAGRLAELIR